MKNEFFLKWWLTITLIIVGLIFSWIYGLPQDIWFKDQSCLSAVTMMVFFVFTFICGYNILIAELTPKANSSLVNKLNEAEETGWFFSEVCLNLGMLGTIIGFVLMLAGFETLNIKEPTSIQKLLSELGRSMATALYTTMVGLACGQLLKLQYFILGLAIKAAERKMGPDADK